MPALLSMIGAIVAHDDQAMPSATAALCTALVAAVAASAAARVRPVLRRTRSMVIVACHQVTSSAAESWVAWMPSATA